MPKEVQEQFQRFRKEEVGYLFTFYATDNIGKAAEKWRGKSVSFKSPKTGRIFRTKNNSEKRSSKTEENGKERFSNRWSKLFNDFGKAKVSDFEYHQPKVRESSSYKPFWATKVVQAFRKSNSNLTVDKTKKSVEKNNATISFLQNENTAARKSSAVSFLDHERTSRTIFENEIETLTISKQVETVERSVEVSKGFSFVKDSATTPKFTLTNKGFTFVKDGVVSPALSGIAKAKAAKLEKASPEKRLSTVEHHHEHRLTLPSFYKGSQMYMPTGEPLYWVRYLFLVLFSFKLKKVS